MSEVEWTHDSVIRLVDEYRQKPELWDNNHSSYRVQTIKYEAWSNLANTFQCDIADLRKKINSILASHRREKVKVRCGGRSSWFLYDHLDFLPHHLENTNCEVEPNVTDTRHNSETEQSSDNDNNHEDDELIERASVMVKQEPITVSEKAYVKPTYRYKTHKPRLTIRPVRRKIIKEVAPTSKFDSKILETLRLIRRSDLSRKRDECDSFGEYIADSLRKHDERTQSMIKQAINNILFEQEMKKYNSGHYAVVLTRADDNPLVIDNEDSQ